MPPAPTAHVNDYAALLSPAERTRLEMFLAEREAATGTQVAIAIFRALEGESLEDFSIRLAERWRVGRKRLDNGAILLVFVDDRKVRLEVGYGLEGAVPDAVAGRIIRETIAPRFREGRYAAGLEAAARALFDRAGGTPSPAPERRGRAAWQGALPILFFFVVALLFLFVAASQAARHQGSRRAYTLGRRGWYVPPIGGGVAGGRSGGGFSGGGFSGGGGSFGGGGASGSW